MASGLERDFKKCATCNHPRWRHNPNMRGSLFQGKCTWLGCRCLNFAKAEGRK